MTISRAKGAGFSSGDKLTSTEANTMDLNPTYCVDKRSGQTDTLESIVSCTGSGRIVPSYEAGADADTTYSLSSGITVINTGTLTAARAYTLSNTGAVQGDIVTVVNAGTTYNLTVKNAAAATLLVLGAGNVTGNQSRWGQFLYNGSAWVLLTSSYAPQQLREVFTANGTYTVPGDVYKLLVIGCGSGGAGGGGCGGFSATNYATDGNIKSSAGGGGGGAAPIGVTYVDTTPGTAYTVTIAAASTGGTAGAGGAAGNLVGGAGGNGADGSSTTFGSVISFRGGGGGVGAPASLSASIGSSFQHVPGGRPIQNATKPNTATLTTAHSTVTGVSQPGEGGYGISAGLDGAPTTAASGNYPAVSSTTAGSGTTTPGAGGAQGATFSSGTAIGGGGGGGGGASAFGNGGAGGAGGTPNGVTVGVTGTAGGVGAGGGGGGAGGTGTGGGVPGAAGGVGGAGGAGVCIVIPVR